jgi:hypothetical protein
LQLPLISSLEFVAILRRLGFRIVAMDSARTVMRRGDDGCVVPHRIRIAEGVARLMLAAASVTLLDFLEAQGSTVVIPAQTGLPRSVMPHARALGRMLQ